MKHLAKQLVEKQPVYEPGRPIEDVARELGLDLRSIIKLASNESPFGPSPMALEAAREALTNGHRYPDGNATHLKEKIAETLSLKPEQLVLGNGSNEIIELLGHAFLRKGDEAVMGKSAFIVYKLVTLLFEAVPVEVPLAGHRHDLRAMADRITDKTRMVFLPSPNNPTGTANEESEILAFARDLPPHVVFVFDEAYAEYLDSPPDLRPLIEEGRNVVCLRTFSKIYGLAALRIGYGYGSAEWAALLNRVRQPFNTNAVAQVAALAALDDRKFVSECRRRTREGKEQLERGLAAAGIEFVPSEGNFIMIKVGDGRAFFERMQREGVIVRPLDGYGLSEFVRVSIGTAAENERFVRTLESFKSSSD